MNADEFNALYPVGTRVVAYPGIRPEHPVAVAYRKRVDAGYIRRNHPDPCKRLDTATRTPAWTLGHGEPVVSVDGYPGGISLEHVDPVQSAGAYTPPAPYVRDDGVTVCAHMIPTAPGSCTDCWDLVKWDHIDAHAATRGEPGEVTQ